MAETHHLHGLPTFKTWGRQRHLAFAKPSGSPTRDVLPPFDASPDAGGTSPLDDGFEQIRTKLMAHLHHAADKLNLTVTQQPPDAPDSDDASKPEEETLPKPRPRRRRRRSCTRRRRRRDSSPSPSPSPPPTTTTTTRSSRARLVAADERRRFSVSLSREEINEDFYALTGRRASGRPKRRPPAVRKHVEVLFPGLGLSEITASCYDVAPPRARSRVG